MAIRRPLQFQVFDLISAGAPAIACVDHDTHHGEHHAPHLQPRGTVRATARLTPSYLLLKAYAILPPAAVQGGAADNRTTRLTHDQAAP